MPSSKNLEDLLLTDAFFEDPYPTYQQLRSEAPVMWSPKLSSWLVSGYRECADILRDHENYSSFGRVAYLLDQLPEEMQSRIEPLRAHYSVGLAHSDPPIHTRLRKVMTGGLNATLSRGMRERVLELVTGLLDPMIEAGEFDFVESFAYPLPATVITEMIGAPVEDIDKFKDWADAIAALFELGGRMSPESADKGLECLAEIREYIGDLVKKIKAEPGDNIMSLLVHAEEDGDKLTQQELISTAVTLFVAGHETTTNLLAMTVKALIENPDQKEMLIQNPDKMRTASMEFMRHASIIPRAWRMTNVDTEIGGVKIPKGQMVMALLGSANYDESVFEEPNHLNLSRKPNRHFGFGSGIHLCMGAPLAQVEIDVAIGEILRRMPNLEMTGAPEWRHDFAIRGLKKLPLRIVR